jgi:pimeloyl-ACP methyl ester carboxylesterase
MLFRPARTALRHLLVVCGVFSVLGMIKAITKRWKRPSKRIAKKHQPESPTPDHKLRRCEGGDEDAMEVEFADVDGVTLRGRLYLPQSSNALPAPTLIMAHGFSLTWRQGLVPFARACQKSGIAVLLFDHRALGGSDGHPRGAIGWWTQLRGYQRALDFLTTADLGGAVDTTRLAVWGFSYSSSMALFLGAVDERVSAVVAVAPGYGVDDQDDLEADSDILEALKAEYRENTRRVSASPPLGKPMPVVRAHGPWPLGAEGRTKASSWFAGRIPDPKKDAEAFFKRRGGPKTFWCNSARWILESMPDVDRAVPHLKVPTLLIAIRHDKTCSFHASLELFEALPAKQTRQLHVVEAGGHLAIFDTPLVEGDESAAPAQQPEETRLATEAVVSFLQGAFMTSA